MNTTVSPLWRSTPRDLPSRLKRTFDKALSGRNANNPATVHFRADDIAVSGSRFLQLMNLFYTHRVPLSLAVVPAWLTPPRWQALKRLGSKAPGLWCWHQHGWRHQNHEPSGKKQEFGPSRAPEAIEHDLLQGRQRLENLMEDAFHPVFTPPWNRCSKQTLQLLRENFYQAVSRSTGATPPAPTSLPDFAVGVDLHTAKAANAAQAWRNLWSTLSQDLATGCCGIMLHHQRMNTRAVAFLGLLLDYMVHDKRLQIVHLKHLSQERRSREIIA
jgi:hypothetical protein